MLDYYIIDNFLDNSTVDEILKNIDSSSYITLDGDKEKHLVGKTNYTYNVYRDNIRDNKQITEEVFRKLNSFYKTTIGKECPVDNINPLNFFTKSFDPNKGFYDLHTEDPKYFGDIVFMLYLTDEQDGELVLPNYNDCLPIWTDGFQSMVDKVDVKYVDKTVSILPKRNRCVFVKVGLAHYVKPCSGNRYTLTGWSFASDEYYKEFYNNITLETT
jgi:hypothetical protein